MQLDLPFDAPRKPTTLVVLSAADLAYRQKCIDQDLEFTWGFLMETRAQRIGATTRCLEAMLSYERNRELAEEASIMRSPDWDSCKPVWIDWQKIECRAKSEAEIRARDFAEYRKQLHQPAQKSTRTKRAAQFP